MQRGLGVKFGIEQGDTFSVFALGIHYHKDNEMGCEMRSGVVITVLGLVLAIGVFAM